MTAIAATLSLFIANVSAVDAQEEAVPAKPPAPAAIKAITDAIQADIASQASLRGARVASRKVDARNEGFVLVLNGAVPIEEMAPALQQYVTDWQTQPRNAELLATERIVALELPGDAIAVGSPGPTVEQLPPEQRAELDRFVRDLESRMSVDPLLQSAAVSGWRIARIDEAARRLELELMALDAAQQEALQTLARAQIAADSYWSQANPTIGEVVVQLRSPPPVSPLRMVRYLQEGHKAFRNCDFLTARTAFQMALMDAPDAARREVINYWCVLCDLALNRPDLVQARLVWLLEANPLGQGSLNVATALERVQGPLRWALIRAERSVLLSRAERRNSYDLPPPSPVVQPYDEPVPALPRETLPPAPPQTNPDR